jgi:hypothetical protein
MAVFVNTTNLNPTTFVTPTSRYASSKILRWGEEGLLTFETYKRTPIPQTDYDQFTTITPKYEYRPDLLAYDTFGEPDLWWKLMQANNIWDIFDFTVGRTIRIPFSF